MEYQKTINLLNNTPNQSTKFRTKKRVQINYDSRGTYNTNNQIKFKTSMLRSSLCDYSDTYILVKGNISITAQAGNNPNKANKKVVFKNYHIGITMPMYKLIEYSDNYSKTSGRLWQDYRDEAALTDASTIANFHASDNSALFKFKQNGTQDVEIMAPLKYLNNFGRTLEMPLINCGINQSHFNMV